MTIFKYNINFLKKNQFTSAIIHTLKPNGIAIITSMKESHCFFTPSYERLYLINILQQTFKLIKLSKIKHDSYTKNLMIYL